MGDAQSIPILGEAVTMIESGTKITASGACAIVGTILQPIINIRNSTSDDQALKNPFLNFSEKLALGAKNSWTEYIEKSMLAGAVNIIIKQHLRDTEGEKRVREKVLNSIEGFADSLPVLGHAKGWYHYIANDTEHGNRCMINATRGVAILAVGAITGGVGGGAILAGGIGVGTGFTYDATASFIDSSVHNENRFHGTTSLLIQILEEGDPNTFVDLLLAAAADFASAAKAQKMAKRPKNQNQALKDASKNAEKSFTENNSTLQGDGHVSTLAKDRHTNQTFEGYNQQAPELSRQHVCAEQQALSHLHEMGQGLEANVQTCSMNA